MRRNLVHQTDPNTPLIVKALEAVGASVEHLGGKGVPDLLVGYNGVNYLMEVKERGKTLNENQERWHGRWKGQATVVRTVGDALRIVGVEHVG